jgi:TPR repeat protein
LGGYTWLAKAAAQDYPPAVWLVGVRLKYGILVPMPKDWNGPGGNVFPQPERGQQMIDHAVNDLGFKPTTNEESYYFQHYRRDLPP